MDSLSTEEALRQGTSGSNYHSNQFLNNRSSFGLDDKSILFPQFRIKHWSKSGILKYITKASSDLLSEVIEGEEEEEERGRTV